MRTVEDNISDLLEKVEQLATELEYSLERVWIPVTERLPEICEEVLATDKTDIFCAWIDSNGEWASASFDYDKNFPVTHWMPLPKLPKTYKKRK